MTKARVEGEGASPSKPGKVTQGKAPRLHLRSVRSEQAADGSIVHHHTYADSKEARFPHPERQNMATSATAEEAGQHVSDMFSQNGMSGGAQEAGQGAGDA